MRKVTKSLTVAIGFILALLKQGASKRPVKEEKFIEATLIGSAWGSRALAILEKGERP